MALKVGDVRYFVVHAYYHYIGEVVEVTGRKECVLKNVVRVHSDSQDFTAFFEKGFSADTKYTFWPDETVISGWLVDAPWPYEVPTRASRKQRR